MRSSLSTFVYIHAMRLKFSVPKFLLLLTLSPGFGQVSQKLVALADADSNFVKAFPLQKDIRFFYGLQGNNLSIGSANDSDTQLNGDLYRNTNDYIGAGLTYGWLDGDLSYSLRNTTYLKEESSNLTQFKLAFNFTRRKIVFRWYFLENTGVVLSSSDNEFESAPSLHEVRLGMQVTYIHNSSAYSYRASMYQSEYQVKTAGSLLLRVEPFYRNLGTKSGSMIPEEYDVATRFANQTGLEYVKAPGIIFMPGYGINVVVPNTHYFISPILFAGVGLAHNSYEATTGKGTYTNIEYAANFSLNTGYNGYRSYAKLHFTWSAGYAVLDPAYLTTSNVALVFTYGIRFQELRKR